MIRKSSSMRFTVYVIVSVIAFADKANLKWPLSDPIMKILHPQKDVGMHLLLIFYQKDQIPAFSSLDQQIAHGFECL